MVKVKEERILVKPEKLKPSSPLLEVIGAINPGAIRTPNGEIVLYVRVIEKLTEGEDSKYYYSPRMAGQERFELVLDKFEKRLIKKKGKLDFIFKDGTKRLTFISTLRRFVLDSSGLKIKRAEQKSSFPGFSWDGELGIEDPRITKIGKLYVISYVGLTRSGSISTNLAISNDCKKWYRRGIIFGEQNKDVVIFPELISGEYVALNRPEGNFEFSPPHIWISYSKDLESWGRNEPLIFSKRGEWDFLRNGAGPPPIKTEKGWLLLYHGVKEGDLSRNFIIREIRKLFGLQTKTYSYNVGALLLDLKNPKKIIAKTREPILLPRRKHEKGIFFEKKDVIFPTGIVLDKNRKDLLIYSGGADVVTTVKKVALREIMGRLEKI